MDVFNESTQEAPSSSDSPNHHDEQALPPYVVPTQDPDNFASTTGPEETPNTPVDSSRYSVRIDANGAYRQSTGGDHGTIIPAGLPHPISNRQNFAHQHQQQRGQHGQHGRRRQSASLTAANTSAAARAYYLSAAAAGSGANNGSHRDRETTPRTSSFSSNISSSNFNSNRGNQLHNHASSDQRSSKTSTTTTTTNGDGGSRSGGGHSVSFPREVESRQEKGQQATRRRRGAAAAPGSHGADTGRRIPNAATTAAGAVKTTKDVLTEALQAKLTEDNLERFRLVRRKQKV